MRVELSLDEVATVLAALSYYYQGGQGEPENRKDSIHDEATGKDIRYEVMSSLDNEELRQLHSRIQSEARAEVQRLGVEVPDDPTLADLAGAHELSGFWLVSDGCAFIIDGITYVAIEDPKDGYRSCMEALKIYSGNIMNQFTPCKVIGQMNDDVLEFLDAKTRKIVLRVGTSRDDSMYPCFIEEFRPQHMSINAAQFAEDQARSSEQLRIDEALKLINDYGGIDGGHHKQWVLDQVVRVLTGDGYEEWVRKHRDGKDGPHTYDWDKGIAP